MKYPTIKIVFLIIGMIYFSSNIIVAEQTSIHSPMREMMPSPAPIISPEYTNSIKYALVCLINKTGSKVDYQYRWGAETWKTESIKSNKNKLLYREYSESKRTSPEVEIQFYIGHVSSEDLKKIQLKKYTSSIKKCSFGKKYFFRINSESKIDLLEE